MFCVVSFTIPTSEWLDGSFYLSYSKSWDVQIKQLHGAGECGLAASFVWHYENTRSWITIFAEAIVPRIFVSRVAFPRTLSSLRCCFVPERELEYTATSNSLPCCVELTEKFNTPAKYSLVLMFLLSSNLLLFPNLLFLVFFIVNTLSSLFYPTFPSSSVS